MLALFYCQLNMGLLDLQTITFPFIYIYSVPTYLETGVV